MDGEQELKKLHSQMADILKFVNQELMDCLVAFEHVVLLCEGLSTLNKDKLSDEILSFNSDNTSSIEDSSS